MKTLLSLALLANLLVGNQSVLAAPPSYQVIEPHPEEVRLILPYIKTRFQGGRLWIVDLKSPKSTPAWVMKFLRVADPKRLRHYTPTHLSKTGLPAIPTQLLSDVSKEKLQAAVEKISSFKDRSVGSADNQAAQKWIETQLQEMGYEVKIFCYEPGACSVIGEKRGTTKADDVILVEGHFDSVGKEFAGADDNATGTASALEIARVLKNYTSKHTLRFFLTNGEEAGLFGAEHYAKTLESAGLLKSLKLVINMDMVGYNSNGIVELETDAPWNALALWFAQLTEKYTTLKSKITLGAWGSDHVPFLQRNVPALLTIEDWSTKTPCYHQGCDKPKTVNYNYATEITKLNAAAVLSKDVE